VVLFFYPLDFTFVCPVRAPRRDQSLQCLTEGVSEIAAARRAAAAADARDAAQTEIIAFSDRAKEFAAIDTAVRTRRPNGRPALCSLRPPAARQALTAARRAPRS
jgi:peroxiredoxin